MKLFRVQILNDYPEHRGGMIYSTTSGQMAFLDREGKLHHFDRAQAQAVLCVFDEMHERTVLREDSIPLVKWIAYTERIKKIFVPEIDLRTM